MTTAIMPELLTTEEVAARLRVSTDTVGAWLRAGTLAGIKIGPGRLWRIPSSVIDALVAVHVK